MAIGFSPAFELVLGVVVKSPEGGEIWKTGTDSPDHTITWFWPGLDPAGFRIEIEYQDGNGAFQSANLTSSLVAGNQRQVALQIAPSSVPSGRVLSESARIRVVAVGYQGSIDDDVSEEFVAWADAPHHVLMNRENHIFVWDAIPADCPWQPADVDHYEIKWERNPMSDTRDPVPPPFDAYRYQHPQRYIRVTDQQWLTMPPGEYGFKVIAVRKPAAGGGTWVYPEQRFVRVTLHSWRGAVPSCSAPPAYRGPVLLVHGIWETFDNFGCALRCALMQDGFEVWTLDYPNIGDIRHGAAGLARAAEYLTETSGSSKIKVIGKSMGGIVARTYMQDLAKDPDPDVTGSILHGDRIDALVTLDSPHGGALAEAVWVLGFGLRFDRQLVPAPYAAKQLSQRDDEHLLRNLKEGYSAGNEFESGHLFIQGFTTMDPFQPSSCNDVGFASLLWTSLLHAGGSYFIDDPNDGAVASKDQTLPIANPSRDARKCVAKNHTTVALLDANSEEYSGVIRPFLMFDQLPVETRNERCCPALLPCTTILSRVSAIVERPGGQGGSNAGSLSSAAASEPAAIAGARVVVSPSDPEFSGSIEASTGPDGRVVMGVSPGSYTLSLEARGYVGRSIPVTVDADGDGMGIAVTLKDDPAFLGPRGPSILLSGGALATGSNPVTAHLNAEGATEMLIGQDAAFTGSAWQPYTPTIPVALPSEPGDYPVLATFRNASGVTSDTVGTWIELLPAGVTSLAVTSTPSGASIGIDGRATGMITPATLDSIPLGDHTVYVQLQGYALPTGAALLTIEPGNNETHFSLQPTASPSQPAPNAPIAAWVLSRTPTFQWNASSDPDAGDFLSYRLRIASDASFDQIIRDIQGTEGAFHTLQAALNDSMAFWWDVEARDSHGLTSGPSSPVGPIVVDATPPLLNLVYPTEGVSMLVGQPITFQWGSADWSGVDSLNCWLSRDGGATFDESLFHGEPNDSAHVWTADGAPSEQCKLRFTAYDAAGNQTTAESGPFRVSIATEATAQNAVPRVYALHEAVPNPANPAARIPYDVPAASRVRVEVFDIIGRRAAVLVDRVVPAGRWETKWDGTVGNGSRAASGVWFVRMEAGGRSFTRKVVVLR